MAVKKEIGAQGLRIISLQAENVKKLTAVEINPNGSIVTITGGNGQGKSSVLDAIWWAVGGTANIQGQPVRKGQTKARIRLDLGEIIVERRFTEKSSVLVVESAEGARFPSPQTVMDGLIGELAFDPLAFTRMDPKKQADELRRVAEIDVDLDVIDGQIAKDFDRRTEVNREAKSKRAAAEAIVVAKDLPAAPVDESALVDEIQKAGEHNAGIETRKGRREQAQRDIADHCAEAIRHDERAARLRREAEEADQAAAAARAKAEDLKTKLASAEALPEPVDVTAIRAKLDAAKQTNAKIGQRERRTAIEAEAIALERQATELTESIDARRKTKTDAIARAKMPVAGLGLENGVVTYGGIPFDQASAAEQLKVSFAIAKAANPKLRVILIKDGSLLDETSLQQIAEMARDGDYQVWCERVDTSGKIGVYIEDGAVRAVDGEPVAAKEPETA